MLTVFRKAALIGLALTERAKEVADDLAKKGEESQSEEARRIKAFFESAQKGEQELNQKMSDLGKKISESIRFPSRADIDRLEKELSDLAAQFRRWEATRRDKGEPSA